MKVDQTALTEAIALTDEILLLLEDSDFRRIAQIDVRRQALIERAFAQTVEQIDRIKARHLHHLNQQVVEKLGDLKQSVLQNQQQIRNAARATRAYENHW